jgi:urea transporter
LNSKRTLLEKTEQRLPFAIIILKGIGQIMLQECAYTGLFFLVGIFYGSFAMGFVALLATIFGTITAQFLGYDKTEIDKGIYGFSAALVGVALAFYFEPVIVLWLAILIGAAVATMIQHWFIIKKIPVFTLPFILVTWLLLYLFKNVYPLEPAASLTNVMTPTQDFAFALRGFGQVIFQGSLFAGIAFFIGVFVSSPVRALYGLVAALIAGVLSSFYNAPTADITMGLFSYNAVLCAIVFASNKVTDAVWAFFAVVVSIAVSFIMSTCKLTPLTFPFVVGTCIILALQNLTSKLLTKPNTF